MANEKSPARIAMRLLAMVKELDDPTLNAELLPLIEENVEAASEFEAAQRRYLVEELGPETGNRVADVLLGDPRATN